MYLPYMENDDLKMKIAKLQKKLLEAGSPKNDDGAQTSTGPERRVTRSMRAKVRNSLYNHLFDDDNH